MWISQAQSESWTFKTYISKRLVKRAEKVQKSIFVTSLDKVSGNFFTLIFVFCFFINRFNQNQGANK